MIGILLNKVIPMMPAVKVVVFVCLKIITADNNPCTLPKPLSQPSAITEADRASGLLNTLI